MPSLESFAEYEQYPAYLVSTLVSTVAYGAEVDTERHS
jgi:hypothetical protein